MIKEEEFSLSVTPKISSQIQTRKGLNRLREPFKGEPDRPNQGTRQDPVVSTSR